MLGKPLGDSDVRSVGRKQSSVVGGQPRVSLTLLFSQVHHHPCELKEVCTNTRGPSGLKLKSWLGWQSDPGSGVPNPGSRGRSPLSSLRAGALERHRSRNLRGASPLEFAHRECLIFCSVSQQCPRSNVGIIVGIWRIQMIWSTIWKERTYQHRSNFLQVYQVLRLECQRFKHYYKCFPTYMQIWI